MAIESTENLLTVSELTRLSRLALEKSLPSCRVAGEISNFSRASSGHWYFTLKDAAANVRAVMFRNRNQFVDWLPRDGEHVELRGQPTLYEARGDFQLVVDAMRKGGQGLLFEAFLKLKGKLEKEGLFLEARKRKPPRYPKSIGIITSPQAAALRDVLTTLRQRWPLCEAVLYPTAVQGEGAVEGLIRAISLANEIPRCQILLLVRGGGSLEDLHAFNDENLARAISTSRLPIITGVGHETDFTIADFVADLRAPTPTGAAQYATPSIIDEYGHVQHFARKNSLALKRAIQTLAQQLDGLSRRIKHPHLRSHLQRQYLNHATWRLSRGIVQRISSCQERLQYSHRIRDRHQSNLTQKGERLKNSTARMFRSIQHSQISQKARLTLLEQQLKLLNPDAVLHRGYSIIRNRLGSVVQKHNDVAIGETVSIRLACGGLDAEIKDRFE